MKTLDVTFTDRTFRYDQIARQGMLAIYRQTHNVSGIQRYEVVKISTHPAQVWPNGAESPEREAYPGANAWGRLGWTFHTHASAQNYFHALRAREAPATYEDHQEKSV